MIYLDNAASTAIDPAVLEEMLPYLSEQYGNPSSLHKLGQSARAAVDKARMSIASYIACQPTEILFTANATESCNWALIESVERKLIRGQQAHLVVSSIEHSAVLKTADFLKRYYSVLTTFVDPTPEGFVDVQSIADAITEDTVLVSVMMVNNEIGTLQDIASIGELCRKQEILFHSDACQATPYYALNVDELKVDLLSMNASKVFGPKGVGVLYVREGTEISAWTFGGGQEFGMRAGTENVPAIVGFGKAVDLLQANREERVQYVSGLRDSLWEQLQKNITYIELNGSLEDRSPNNLNVYIPNTDGETLVKKLDMAGFAVSSGSACASGNTEPSHVLLALGYEEERAKSSIRISLSHLNTEEEMGKFVAALKDTVS